jgi:hypothetical protein
VVLDPGPYPFKGEVLWLTPEQGGRSKGIPPVSDTLSYAHVAHVPPHPSETASASFVLRGWDPNRWRSRAEGKWLIVENGGDQTVTPGTVILIAEGARASAIFLVDTVQASD